MSFFRKFLTWLALTQAAFAATPNDDIKTYFRNNQELEQYLIDSSDLGDDIDHLELEAQANGYWRLMFRGMNRELGEDGTRNNEPVAVLLDYSYDANRIIGGTGRMLGITFCNDMAYPDRVKPSCYGMPSLPTEQIVKATRIARHLVQLRLPVRLKHIHKRALSVFQGKNIPEAANESVSILGAAPWKVVPISAENAELYNDLGFFAEQGGKAKEAISVLEEVVKAVPNRTVAYLNLGDAYVKLPDLQRAKAAYKQYQKLMQQEGKGAKIPKRIQKYLN